MIPESATNHLQKPFGICELVQAVNFKSQDFKIHPRHL